MNLSKNFCRLFIPGFLVASPVMLFGNPTGGTVSNGAATIAGQGTASLQVRQTSNAAIINWQSYSIGKGEQTQYLMPSQQSAVLNRVVGGGISTINGTLKANGQVYLINQNGIVVGPSGIINAGGFTGSTRDIVDSDFLKKNYHFAGPGNGGVTNHGHINGGLGNVVLIGKSVDNQGSIQARHGTVALVAGDDVLLAQQNADGSTITVDSSPLSTKSRQTGVTNGGSIMASAVELKAAGGNIYAMAINNSGAIRASTLSKQGGHIWLTADTGSITNSGILNASATSPHGNGGTVTVKGMGGTTTNTASGQILAKGGIYGTGGQIETSGQSVKLAGTVSAGRGGNWLIDPTTMVIDSTAATTLEGDLASGDVTDTSSGYIKVIAPIAWSTSSTLTLTASTSITFSADIIATSDGTTTGTPTGGLSLTAGSGSNIYANSNIAVRNFMLTSGNWIQNGSILPIFAVSNNFELQNGSSFLRVAGGNGSTGNPYQIIDAYGLQGMGSTGMLGYSFALASSVDASTSSNWYNSATEASGFAPIGNSRPFTGTFDGNGYNISGLVCHGSSSDPTIIAGTTVTGLFGTTGAGSVIENVNLVGGDFSGYQGASLVQINRGTVSNCTSSAEMLGGGNVVYSSHHIGGLVGLNYGTVENCSFTGKVRGSSLFNAGGVVGDNQGIVSSCSSSSGVGVGGSTNVGGVVGYNGGIVTNCSFSGYVGGTIDNSGGVVGNNAGTVSLCASTSPGSYPDGITNAGGIVGYNSGNVTNCNYASTVFAEIDVYGGVVGDNAGKVTNCNFSGTISGYGDDIAGVVGINTGFVSSCSSTGHLYLSRTANAGGAIGFNYGTVTHCSFSGYLGGSDLNGAGGVVGCNYGIIALSSSSGTVNCVGLSNDIGGVVGQNTNTVTQCYNTGIVKGGDVVGGLVGDNIGTVETSHSTGVIFGNSEVGGLVGLNQHNIERSYATGNVIGSSYEGGLVGLNDSRASDYGIIDTCYATGAVTGLNFVGGLVGKNTNEFDGSILPGANITNCYATGAVHGVTYVGGLVGNNYGPINTSFATGTVTGSGNYVGGLVGQGGDISASYAMGRVSGSSYVGGLVGLGASIESSYATGNVSASGRYVGGLEGKNGSNVTNCHATGPVSGGDYVGGLIGFNTYNATVEASYSTGDINGGMCVGGLVGLNYPNGMVKTSYATGSVNGTDIWAGGLVGLNDGTIETSYSRGLVCGASYVGGLTGDNPGTIESTYATGAVSGSGKYVGGLSGGNEFEGTVKTSYSTGTVSGTSDVGGLLGYNDNIVINNYFSSMPNPGLYGIGNTSSNSGAYGETTAQLQEQSTFAGFDFSLGGTWGINGFNSSGQINNGMPYFQWEYPIFPSLQLTNPGFSQSPLNYPSGKFVFPQVNNNYLPPVIPTVDSQTGDSWYLDKDTPDSIFPDSITDFDDSFLIYSLTEIIDDGVIVHRRGKRHVVYTEAASKTETKHPRL